MPPSPPITPNDGGLVADILLSASKGGAVIAVAEVEAVAGCGLVGDRNFHAAGAAADKHVTLIESENIRAFTDATGLAFSAEDSRRNIVTRGIRLNALLGREFRIGPVRVKALELCEPCSLLAKRTHRAVLWGLVGKGGLRCEILTSGAIRRGDAVGV